MKRKAIIFDLWNTLIKPEQEFHLMKLIQKQYNLPTKVYNEEIKKKLMTRPLKTVEEITRFMKTEYGLEEPRKEKLKILKWQIESDTKQVTLYKDTIQTLEYLQKQELKIGLISNASTPHKDPFYKFELGRYFDHVCFSCDAGYWKPEKEIYLQTMEALGVKPEETIMTGDNKIKDYQTPTGLGITGIHLDRKGESDAEKRIKNLCEIIYFIKT